MCTANTIHEVFNLSDVAVDTVPFRHFVIPEFMIASVCETLLTWFELVAPWQLHVEDGFYDCFNLDLQSVDLPDDLKFLTADSTAAQLREWVGRRFSVQLGPEIDVAAHKLIPPHRMGIHTDFGPIGQTHRLLVQLNRGWSVQNGGLLMMFDEPEPRELSDTFRYYLPHHGMGIGFEISANSYHAINPVAHGERYTLCFSFYSH